MRLYLLILNIINFVVFILIIVIFNSVFNFEKVITNPDEELVLFDVIDALKNVFIYLIYACMILLAYASAFGMAMAFGSFGLYNSSFMFNFIVNFFKGYLNLWFTFPEGTAPDLGRIGPLIIAEIVVFTTDIYLFMFQVLFALAIIYAIRAILQNDPKYNLRVVGALVLMIVIPYMVFKFRDMLEIFTVTIPYLQELEDPIDKDLFKLPLDNFFAFMASPIALLAIIFYIYLEMSFQINYTDTVTKPSLERGSRLEAQISLLERESLLITASVDKIKEEAKKRIEELELGEKEAVGKFFAKTGQRFSYIKEMIEKKKLELEEKKLVTAASKTRRLGRYIDRLFREDPEARDTLTAKTAAPRAVGLVTSTISTFAFRLIVLIILSFIIIHPRWFFIYVFNLPPAITESVAMYSPEVVITLLVPIMLLFPVIAWTISYVKKRNLIIRLKQEGRIKEILTSVGDYVKKEEKEKKEKEEPDIEAPATAAT